MESSFVGWGDDSLLSCGADGVSLLQLVMSLVSTASVLADVSVTFIPSLLGIEVIEALKGGRGGGAAGGGEAACMEEDRFGRN